MTKLFVSYSQRTVDYYRSPEKYGDWSETKDFNVTGVSLDINQGKSKFSGEYEEFGTLDGDVVAGDTVYVLWMQYRTGDSFGSSNGNGEIIWVFKDKQIANDAYEAWDANKDEYTVSTPVGNGAVLTIGNPGSGYFDRVEQIYLDSFVVTE